ncbi:unnamed protein product [Ambrosiozyma monospora]|uniref:Unnamed protein product n=1 Tax=Ambrosiozyma monospora TaxID=43982 RepID=A0ACB5TYG8_AMBMO|nr:unnamed protein product [Ambrosiozyma monospora]
MQQSEILNQRIQAAQSANCSHNHGQHSHTHNHNHGHTCSHNHGHTHSHSHSPAQSQAQSQPSHAHQLQPQVQGQQQVTDRQAYQMGIGTGPLAPGHVSSFASPGVLTGGLKRPLPQLQSNGGPVSGVTLGQNNNQFVNDLNAKRARLDNGSNSNAMNNNNIGGLNSTTNTTSQMQGGAGLQQQSQQVPETAAPHQLVCKWNDCNLELLDKDLNEHIFSQHVPHKTKVHEDNGDLFQCEWLDCMFSTNELESLLEHIPDCHGDHGQFGSGLGATSSTGVTA